MIGLGAPTPPQQDDTKAHFDKMRELEERIAKLEKMSVWVKVALAFLGIYVLTNKTNRNEN